MGRVRTAHGRDEKYVPSRLGVMVTQVTEAEFLYAQRTLFDSVFDSVCNVLLSASRMRCLALHTVGLVLIFPSTLV
jgi:hypothetical protein